VTANQVQRHMMMMEKQEIILKGRWMKRDEVKMDVYAYEDLNGGSAKARTEQAGTAKSCQPSPTTIGTTIEMHQMHPNVTALRS
jgi:hypothetical protein